jgi:hypothetical protein
MVTGAAVLALWQEVRLVPRLGPLLVVSCWVWSVHARDGLGKPTNPIPAPWRLDWPTRFGWQRTKASLGSGGYSEKAHVLAHPRPGGGRGVQHFRNIEIGRRPA